MHDLWKVCMIEGVRFVGGAIGLCARLWKKHTQRVVGGAVGLVGGVHDYGRRARKYLWEV